MLIFSLLCLSPIQAAGLSLLFPGWGQARLGQDAAARAFVGAELVGWAGVLGFNLDRVVAQDRYRVVAYLGAGASPGWGEEHWSLLEAYWDYDQYLTELYREARELYPDDPDAQDSYVAQNAVGGSWSWSDTTAWREFQRQRRRAQRSGRLALASLGFLVLNRLASGVHAYVVAKTGIGRNTSLGFVPRPDGITLMFSLSLPTR